MSEAIEIVKAQARTQTLKEMREVVEGMKGKILEEYHGRDCEELDRPCGLESSDKLADRCEARKVDELTIDSLLAFIDKQLR